MDASSIWITAQTSPGAYTMKPDMLASQGKFQFSLHQSWVLSTMKVAWLLAAFIAITYTPRASYVLS